jgi:hypothetical protein
VTVTCTRFTFGDPNLLQNSLKDLDAFYINSQGIVRNPFFIYLRERVISPTAAAVAAAMLLHMDRAS